MFKSIDECDQFAMTIGRVMEEASDKVEGNIDEIKADYVKKLQKLEDIIKKVTVSFDYGLAWPFNYHMKSLNSLFYCS